MASAETFLMVMVAIIFLILVAIIVGVVYFICWVVWKIYKIVKNNQKEEKNNKMSSKKENEKLDKAVNYNDGVFIFEFMDEEDALTMRELSFHEIRALVDSKHFKRVIFLGTRDCEKDVTEMFFELGLVVSRNEDGDLVGSKKQETNPSTKLRKRARKKSPAPQSGDMPDDNDKASDVDSADAPPDEEVATEDDACDEAEMPVEAPSAAYMALSPGQRFLVDRVNALAVENRNQHELQATAIGVIAESSRIIQVRTAPTHWGIVIAGVIVAIAIFLVMKLSLWAAEITGALAAVAGLSASTAGFLPTVISLAIGIMAGGLVMGLLRRIWVGIRER